MRPAVDRALSLLFSSLSLLACDDALRLTVVESGGSGSVNPVAGSEAGGTETGASSGTESGGSSGRAGSSSEGGSLLAGGSGTGGDAANAGQPSGGKSGTYPWEATPLYTASYSSHSHPGQYIRHDLDKGFVTSIDTGVVREKQDASFDMIPGLYDPECVSFRAVNINGGFFRHSGSRLYLHPAQDTPLFVADATFCIEPGLADPEGVSFRSANYPERVIHIRSESELWIDDVVEGDAGFASDATFYREAPLSETD